MANFELDGVDAVRRMARRSAHVQRAQAMLVAACLTTLGVVAVAGALLTTLF